MSSVDLVKEVRKTSISTKTKHHAGIGRHGEKAAMIHANHDKCHEHYCTRFAEDIDKNLNHRLFVITSDSGIEILDRK